MAHDWGDGRYEETARQLRPAAVLAVELAALQPNERVLDLGCGNGNASVLALERGAVVTAVDPSPRLRAATEARIAEAGGRARVLAGTGSRLSLPDAEFDAVIAVFSVIFDPDAAACAREMLRVTRSGGRLVITSWQPGGAVNEIAELIRPPGFERPPSAWLAPDSIRALFASHRVELSIDEARLALRAPSAQAWLSDLEANHPYWRMMRGARAEAWSELRQRSLEVLEAANEDPDAFCVTSRYFVTKVTAR